ncbi:MAG TPA: glycosyltransferase family 4 protein [Herbaspirillum sp.]
MNILVVSQYFWPENFRINDLVREWITQGHQVTVLTGRPNYPAGQVFPDFLRDPASFAFFEGASVHRVPMFARGRGSLRLVLNYLSFVIGACLVGPRKLRGLSPDVIFVFEVSPVTVGLPAVLLGRLKRCPVVFWVLDLWPETLAAIGVVRHPRVLAAVGYLVRFIYNRCTLVLGQSRSFLQSIAYHCDNPDKVRYFPSWAEDVFQNQADAPASEIPTAPGTLNILFAGNVGDAQDFPAILDAAERLKHRRDIRWLIVGSGRRSAWVEEQVKARGLSERILLLGQFPVERMPSFYAQADALLVSLKKDPTFSMTIPGKVQSYLAAGRPIVGMLDGEGADVIRRAEAGLVCQAGDGAALAATIERFAELTLAERQRMGVSGQAYAHAEFDRETLMTRLLHLFGEARCLYQEQNRGKTSR